MNVDTESFSLLCYWSSMISVWWLDVLLYLWNWQLHESEELCLVCAWVNKVNQLEMLPVFTSDWEFETKTRAIYTTKTTLMRQKPRKWNILVLLWWKKLTLVVCKTSDLPLLWWNENFAYFLLLHSCRGIVEKTRWKTNWIALTVVWWWGISEQNK